MDFFKIIKELWKEDRHFRISMILAHVSLLVSIVSLILNLLTTK